MRFADRAIPRSALWIALCLAGCSAVSEQPRAEVAPGPIKPLGAAPGPAPAPAPVLAPAPAVTGAPAKPASTAAIPNVPARSSADAEAIPPAAQRAFDDARRALRAGRTDEAERGFKSVIQFHPELGGAHANLGLIHRQAGRLNESAAALEQATKASPRQPVYFNQLGITYRMQGQFTKAREAYERAIELDGQYAAAVLNLGVLYDLYLWDAKRAAEHYERYLAMTPAGDATVTKWLADLKNRKPAAAAAAAAASAAAPAATPRKEKE